MRYSLNVTEPQRDFLMNRKIHFWTLGKIERLDMFEILFPDESEFIHAQVLLEVMNEY